MKNTDWTKTNKKMLFVEVCNTFNLDGEPMEYDWLTIKSFPTIDFFRTNMLRPSGIEFNFEAMNSSALEFYNEIKKSLPRHGVVRISRVYNRRIETLIQSKSAK